MAVEVPEPVSSSRAREILREARRVFLSYGYQRASMMDVARDAEISRAGLYKHFTTKEELFRAVVVDLHEELLSAAEEEVRRAEKLDVETTLVAVFEAYVGRFHSEYGGLPHSQDLYEAGGRLCGAELQEYRERFLSLVADVLRDSASRGEIEVSSASRTAALLHSAVMGLKSPAAPEADLSKGLAEMVGLLVRGMTKPS